MLFRKQTTRYRTSPIQAGSKVGFVFLRQIEVGTIKIFDKGPRMRFEITALALYPVKRAALQREKAD